MALVLMLAAGLLSAAPSSFAIAAEPDAATFELMLPRRAAADEAVWAQVRVGALPRGAEVTVETADGARLGSVSPFGLRSAQQGASYTIPLPAGAIVDGRVQLRLQVTQASAAARAPTPSEVEGVSLIFVPVTK